MKQHNNLKTKITSKVFGKNAFGFIVIAFILLLAIFLTTIFIDYSNKLQPYVPSRNIGTSKKLEGKCLFIVVFLSDDESSFNEEEKQNRFILLDEALDFLGKKAKSYNKSFEPIFNNPDIVLDYKADFNIPDYGEGNSNWKKDILPGIFSKYNIKETIKKYAPDNVSVLYFLNKPGTSHAVRTVGFGIDSLSIKYTEIAVITTGWSEKSEVTSGVYAHEILHMFGAYDLYYENEDYDYLDLLSKKLFPNDIMRYTSHDDITVFGLNEIDAYTIGWIDELKEEYHIFINFDNVLSLIFLAFNIAVRVILFLIICILGTAILIIVYKRIYDKDKYNRILLINKFIFTTLLICIFITGVYFASSIYISASYQSLTREEADIISFSDPNFEAAVREKINKPSGEITQYDVWGIIELDISNRNITDLSGIEYFTSLRALNCNDNKLTNIDVSNNFYLEHFHCKNNQLKALDISRNINLTLLNCYINQLTTLDLNKNTKLAKLYCSSNQLTKLDISKNINLVDLYCGDNQLNSLDVSRNINLETLDCYTNQLTQFDLSKSINLKQLYCGDNKLTTLDVSKNIKLEILNCHLNQLTELDISKNINLAQLYCVKNKFISLDVSKNVKLEALDCSSNQITELDLSKNINLEKLWCGDKLTTLDVSKNIKLEMLDCSSNQITELDLSKNINLDQLHCEDNRLTTLDVSKNINLIELYCYNNNLNDKSAINGLDESRTKVYINEYGDK